jgi:hypothetical protein
MISGGCGAGWAMVVLSAWQWCRGGRIIAIASRLATIPPT